MQVFYMIIGRDALYIYENESAGYKRQYIEGNSEFHYQKNNIRNDLKKLLDILAEEYNLDSRSELTFSVIGDRDSIATQAVTSELEEYISKTYDLRELMPDIIKRMVEDTDFLLKDYGINYDGLNYCLNDGTLQKTDFNLLGYTLLPDDLMKYIG